MRNEYEIEGAAIKVFMTMNDGTVVCALADAEDMEKIAPYRWHAAKQRDGYRIVCHKRTEPKGPKQAFYMHRIVMDAPTGVFVDHINCDPSDNRKANLRFTDYSANGQNRKKLHPTNTSGVKNVTWHKGSKRWQAMMTVKGKSIYIGAFKTIPEAAEAVTRARKAHMPYSQEAMA